MTPKKDEYMRGYSDAVNEFAEGVRIADAVLSWMVKYDLLDAGNEYRASDVLEVLNELAPVDGAALDIGKASVSIAEMVADWYGNAPLPNARITASVVAARLARFMPKSLVQP